MTAPHEPMRDSMSQEPTRLRDQGEASGETEGSGIDFDLDLPHNDVHASSAEDSAARETSAASDTNSNDDQGTNDTGQTGGRCRSDPFVQTVISSANDDAEILNLEQRVHEPIDAAGTGAGNAAGGNPQSEIDTDLYKDLPVGALQNSDIPATVSPSSSHPAAADAHRADAEREGSDVRYEFLEEIARGGLGRILTARDKHIRRDVAIKELLDRYQRHPSAVERFREEAQITGQLEHPSIVPIYDIGKKQNGTSFYSMKLVQGVELHKAIAEFHKLPRGGSARLLRRNDLLRNFVAICNAVAFAHHRGVLHRDLKPQNVMLGEFGETLVLDWGLAKVFDSPELALPGRSAQDSAHTSGSGISSKPGISSDARSAGSQTRIGSVMGTLAYMPPEQAAGRLDDLDARADVYSLGAILYQILTGRAPIQRAPSTEMVQHVLEGNITPPREIDGSIPKPLEAVTLKALALRKEDRYETALLLAAEIDRFLADEPVTAYPEPWYQKTYRWLKRHRTFAISFAAMLLVLGAGALFWRDMEQRRLNDLRTNAREKFAAARESQQLGDLTNASRLFRESLGLLKGEPSLTNLGQQIQDAARDVEAVIDEQTQRRLARRNFEGFLHEADEARFYGWLTSTETGMENRHIAIESARRALERYDLLNSQSLQPPPQYLSTDEVDQIRRVGYELMLLLANAPLGKSGLGEGDAKLAAESLLTWTDFAKNFGLETPAFYYSRAAAFEVLNRPQDVQDALEKGKQLKPSTPLDFFLQGHVELQLRGDYASALENFLQTSSLEPDNYWAMHSAGSCQLQLGKYDEATATFSSCIALRPEFPWAYLTRGAVNFELGRYPMALADFDRAKQLNPRIYGIYVNRSRVYLNQADLATEPELRERKFAAARADLDKAIQLQPAYAAAHINLAEVYRRRDEIDAAIGELNLAMELAPQDPRPYRFRGLIKLQQEKNDEAITDLRRALELETSPEFRAEDLRQLGSVYYRGGDFAEALKHYEEALKLTPNNGDLIRLRAETLLKFDRFEEAVAAYSEYLKLGPPLADVYRGRALAYAKLQKYRDALSDYTQALELEPSSNMLARRGWALLLQSRQLAAQDFDEAIQLQPDNPDSYNGRGYARVLLGDYPAAISDAEEALKRKGGAWQVVYNAATIYSQAASLAGADAARSIEDRRRLEQDYAVRAIDLIREASELFGLENAPKFLTIVENDEALKPIRDTAEFQKLIKRLREGQ